MSDLSTCKVCLEDYPTDLTFEDIEGARYCYIHADICLSCGVYQHNCEREEGAWTKYVYVCSNCDTLLEITSTLPAQDVKCFCNRASLIEVAREEVANA